MDAELERKLRLHGQEHLIKSHEKGHSIYDVRILLELFDPYDLP